MGRELRRVPLDFDWPHNKVWRGFINPHFSPCPQEAYDQCIGGYTPGAKWLEAVLRLLMLVGEEAAMAPVADQIRQRGRTYPHPYLEEWLQSPRADIPLAERERISAIGDTNDRERAQYAASRNRTLLPLTSELVALVEGLSGEKVGAFPGGSMGAYRIQQKLLGLAWLDAETWGVCQVCKGDGMHPDARERYEAWEEEPPPQGDGWQLWETVSEGSPVSPVFPTRKAFVDYLVASGYSRAAAEAFCDSGWAPSMMIVGGKLYNNIESLAVPGESDGAA